MRTQLQVIFKKQIDDKNFTLKIDDPRDDIDRIEMQSFVDIVMSSGIFGEIIPIKAQFITTEIEVMDLEN